MKKVQRVAQWGNELFKVSDEKGCEPHYKAMTLNECYSRFSYHKQAVYDYWKEWLKSNDEGNGWIGIYSYNTNFITLCGKVTIGGIEYGFIIYPSRNVAWKVDKEVSVQ